MAAPLSYNPAGALGGLFAPAYIPGYAPSDAAVQAWRAAHTSNLTPADIPSTAMPGGAVDPAALQAMAWNQPYDLNARRNAVAAAVQAQAQAQAAQQASLYQGRQSPYGDSRCVGQAKVS